MASFDDIRAAINGDLRALDLEIHIVYEELVLPGWESVDRHGFPRTLYGYVMNAFALTDVLSQYRTGSTATTGQTERMTRLLTDYLGSPRDEGETAVRLWRHTLMHTGNPRSLQDQRSGQRLQWLLHWRDHLPRAQHLTFTRVGPDTILSLGGVYLVEDLVVAAEVLFRELSASRALRRQAENVEDELGLARFRVPLK